MPIPRVYDKIIDQNKNMPFIIHLHASKLNERC